MIRIAAIALAIALAGCATTAQARQELSVRGTLNGQPVRLEIDGSSESRSTTSMDPELAAQIARTAAAAAVEGAKAAIPGADAIGKVVATMVPAHPAPTGLDGTAGGALGAAGGLGLLALQQMLTARSHKKDADEGWAKADAYARALPPGTTIDKG